MKKIISTSLFLILLSCNNSANNSNSTSIIETPVDPSGTQPTSNKSISAKPLNWFCSELLHKPASFIQTKLGKPSDCYNCTETEGEVQYYNLVLDAMGTSQTLKIHYFDGKVTWLQYGSSMTYTEDGRACR